MAIRGSIRRTTPRSSMPGRNAGSGSPSCHEAGSWRQRPRGQPASRARRTVGWVAATCGAFASCGSSDTSLRKSGARSRSRVVSHNHRGRAQGRGKADVRPSSRDQASAVRRPNARSEHREGQRVRMGGGRYPRRVGMKWNLQGALLRLGPRQLTLHFRNENCRSASSRRSKPFWERSTLRAGSSKALREKGNVDRPTKSEPGSV